jgi:protein involved in polysaccharide export with SLBB domain
MLLSGCEWNDFFDPGDPKIVGPDQKPLVVPILDSLASGIEGPDTVFPDATDVEPNDLVPEVADYKIYPNDLVNISIFDLLGPGTGEQVKTVRVTETGSINLLFIPPVKAAGLTERELEGAVSKAYEDARLIHDARVSVTVAEARGLTFSIQGNVTLPGEFEITKTDFRMLDALVTAQGPRDTTGIPYAYVIRKLTPPGQPDTGQGNESSPPANTNAPVTPPPQPTMPATNPADLLAPPPTAPSGPQGRANPSESAERTMMMDNLPVVHSSPAFKFDDVQSPADERIIRVPLQQLQQQGELKYNIVIRPGDMIIVPDPIFGVYYLGGHVQRPGAFDLSAGEKMTLKKAWVAAGGADDYSFPSRTEIVRRIGTNREICIRVDLAKVLAMEQPDIYLKPDDMIYVGTHFIAPFEAAIRNSFTLSEGFGFVYDQDFYTNSNTNNNNNSTTPLGTLPNGF